MEKEGLHPPPDYHMFADNIFILDSMKKVTLLFKYLTYRNTYEPKKGQTDQQIEKIKK